MKLFGACFYQLTEEKIWESIIILICSNRFVSAGQSSKIVFSHRQTDVNIKITEECLLRKALLSINAKRWEGLRQ